jgi:hypothetical protein
MKRMFESLKLVVVVAFLLAPLLTGASASAEPVLNGTYPTTGTPSRMLFGPDGNVWFGLAGSTDSKEFGRIAADGTVTEFDTPNDQQVAGLAVGPASTGGPGDQIWMAQPGSVVRWDPSTWKGNALSVTALNGPRGIAGQGTLAVRSFRVNRR